MLFFDIETLPAPEEKYPDLQILFDRKKDKDKRFGRENTETFEQFINSTALHGSFGRLLCIGFALNNDPTDIITGDEKDQLRQFWDLIKTNKPIIGHNILNFDIPFIKHRSIVLGIKNNFVAPKPWENSVLFDTMKEWECGSRERGWSSLDTVARALNLPSSKGELDGSKVAQYHKEGKVQDIYDYCKADVELTRKVYKKLVFADSTLL